MKRPAVIPALIVCLAATPASADQDFFQKLFQGFAKRPQTAAPAAQAPAAPANAPTPATANAATKPAAVTSVQARSQTPPDGAARAPGSAETARMLPLSAERTPGTPATSAVAGRASKPRSVPIDLTPPGFAEIRSVTRPVSVPKFVPLPLRKPQELAEAPVPAAPRMAKAAVEVPVAAAPRPARPAPARATKPPLVAVSPLFDDGPDLAEEPDYPVYIEPPRAYLPASTHTTSPTTALIRQTFSLPAMLFPAAAQASEVASDHAPPTGNGAPTEMSPPRVAPIVPATPADDAGNATKADAAPTPAIGATNAPESTTDPAALPAKASAEPPAPANAEAAPADQAVAPPHTADRTPAAAASGDKGTGTATDEVSGPPAAPQEAGPAQAAATEPAQPPTTLPEDLVRSLQRTQDRMAAGDTDALAIQRTLIARMERQFLAFDTSVWQDPNNARALVTFALSGGSPNTLRAILSRKPLPAIDERLLRGSLSYLEGREDEAMRQLGEIDARDLPGSLSGQVALAQAALWARKDPARSAILLGQARLTAPGTLVEEAALRREILVTAQAANIEKFEQLTSQYLNRFRHSVYAGNFRMRFAAALTRMDFINDPGQFHRLEDLLQPLEPESRREILLVVSQALISQGKTVGAALTAERVLEIAPIGSADADRARLYHGASQAASAENFAAALTELKSIDRARLNASDAELLNAALRTASSVQAADKVSNPPHPSQAASNALPAAAAERPETPLPALAEAPSVLQEVDKILAGAPL